MSQLPVVGAIFQCEKDLAMCCKHQLERLFVRLFASIWIHYGYSMKSSLVSRRTRSLHGAMALTLTDVRDDIPMISTWLSQ